MAKLIGTAGHVDHGKTSLIRALTGIDADRLPEEKSRGMTLDLGFAHIELPPFGRVSLVDVPGHERYLANMLVGALGVDVALLCIASPEGVKQQTKEHYDVLRLLPVEQLVVALTKVDMVDPETQELAAEEIRELLSNDRFAGAPVVPVSSVTGVGLDALRDALSEALQNAKAKKDGPWYLPIDRVFLRKGEGVIVTGTLMQGELKSGESAVLQPGSKSIKVRSIHRHEEEFDQSEFGSRTALRLGGVGIEEVHRGQTIGEPGACFETQCFEAKMNWVTEPKRGLRVRVSIGADEVMGRVFAEDEDSSFAQLRLERMTAAALNQPIIIRRYSPPDLLGGGRVTVPESQWRGKSIKVSEAETDQDRILEVVRQSPKGLDTAVVCKNLGRTPQQLGDEFQELLNSEQLLSFAGRWMTPETEGELRYESQRILWEEHQKRPQQAMLPREVLLSFLGHGWEGKPLARLLARWQEEAAIQVDGNQVSHPDFRVQLNARQSELLERVREALSQAGANVPGALDLARGLGVPIQAVQEIIKLGIQLRELHRIAEDIHYTSEQLQEFATEAADLDQPFAAAAFREKIRSSRKYAIPILEWMDSKGWTTRQGDVRFMKGDPTPQK